MLDISSLPIKLLKRYSSPTMIQALRHYRQHLEYRKRDIANFVRFGFGAPKSCQRIYINPQRITTYTKAFSRSHSGLVVDGDWDLQLRPLDERKKIQMAYEKLATSKTWEQCGAIDHVAELVRSHPGIDGCWNIDDVRERYQRLDKLISHLQRGGEFEEGKGFRESGGIYVHVTRNGGITFGGAGHHRLAICQKLGLDWVPAQLGVVHSDFAKTKMFHEFIQKRSRHGIESSPA